MNEGNSIYINLVLNPRPLAIQASMLLLGHQVLTLSTVKVSVATASRLAPTWTSLTLISMIICTLKLIYRSLVCGCRGHLLLLVGLPLLVAATTVSSSLSFPPILLVALYLLLFLLLLVVGGYRKQLLIASQVNTITIGLSSWKYKCNFKCKANVWWDNRNKFAYR